MNRRDFSAQTAAAVGATALGWSGLAQAQKKLEDGRDYRSLDKRVPMQSPPGKIEVIEFFWYSCPHCNAFEPRLETWIKKLAPDVALRRAPVAFRDSFVPQQRLFYTLEAMGKIEDVHRKVFHAIHVERQALDKQESITAWAEKQGLDKAKFTELYNSFSVQTKARRAAQLQNEFKVQGVPSLGIAGRYYTDGSMAGTMERALQVTDYLIAEVRKNKG